MRFVIDQRMPGDTVFWIIEEDFRFWPPGKDPEIADDCEEQYEFLLGARAADDHAGSSLPPSHEDSKGKGK